MFLMFDFQVSRWLCPSGSSQMNAIAVTISHMEQWNLIARVYMAYEDAKDDCGDAATRASSLTIFRESVIEESEPKRIIPPSSHMGSTDFVPQSYSEFVSQPYSEFTPKPSMEFFIRDPVEL